LKLNDISIVILNWNGSRYLHRFLPSVLAHSGDARVIVADNASTDNSVAMVRTNFPEVEIIINSSNGGFAKGYNQALSKVQSPYYLLLNSDIEVSPNWLQPLLDRIEENELIAGVQPKIMDCRRREKFEHAGASGGFIDRHGFPFCRGRIFSSIECDTGQYDNACEVFWATGAALLIRSDVFHLLNGFDEQFFAHMEEIDWCWRAKSLGYSFYVEPQSIVYHVGGGTLPYSSPRKTFFNFRNSLYMLIKNSRGWLLPTLIVRMIIDGVAGCRFLCIGEFENVRSVLLAHLAMYRNLPLLFRKRRHLKEQMNLICHTANRSPNQCGKYRGSILWAYYFKRVNKFSQLNQRLFK